MGRSAAGGIPILGNLSSSLTGLPLPALAAAAAIALLFVAGKSIVGISDKWEAAQRGLTQATSVAGVSYDKARQFVDQFIQSNKRFVSSQAEVVDSYASLTRSGLAQKEVQRDLNIALDLSAIKHISLSEATDLVNKAEHGRMRGLVDLGIVTKNMVDAQGNLIGGTKSVAAAMDSLEAKTRRGREATESLKQKQNELGNSWQSFSERTGPVLLKVLSFIANAFLTILNIIIDLIGRVGDLIGWLGKIKVPDFGAITHGFRIPGFAAGTDYVPQTMLAVVHQGEQIIPAGQRGRGGNITINLYATVADGPALDRFTNEIAQRLRWASGT